MKSIELLKMKIFICDNCKKPFPSNEHELYCKKCGIAINQEDIDDIIWNYDWCCDKWKDFQFNELVNCMKAVCRHLRRKYE